MTINELKKLIESDEVENIVFCFCYRDCPQLTGSLWAVLAYDHEGSSVVSTFGNQLMTNSRDKLSKTYTSLDRAHAAIKKLGYKGRFEIDG